MMRDRPALEIPSATTTNASCAVRADGPDEVEVTTQTIEARAAVWAAYISSERQPNWADGKVPTSNMAVQED
jgi:hypothetical protein